MTARKAVIGTGVLLLLALLGAAGALIAKGASKPVLTGLLLGVGLGGLNLAVESFSMSWAFRRKPAAILAVSLGGFLVRLVLVCGLTIWFAGLASVDAVTFALTYVATFLAFIGFQIWAVAKITGDAGSPGTGGGGEEG